MFKVGITGGIGSGKTLVCKIFEVLGVPVYYADFHAKRLMESDQGIRDHLVKLFGQDVIRENKINREFLAGIVFKDKDALRLVNELIHPFVRKDFQNWTREHHEKDYVIEEAAILFESGANKFLNFNISVSAPGNMRIRRVMMRDHTTRALVESRMKNQLKEEERNSLADAVIINDETQLLIPQVLDLHKIIIGKTGKLDTAIQ